MTKVYFVGFVVSLLATFFGIGHLVLTQFPEVGQAGAIVSNVHGIGLIGGFLLVFFFFVAICMGE